MIRTILMIALAAVTMSLSNCEQKETIVAADSAQLVNEWKLVDPASGYEITLAMEVDPAAQTIAGVTPFKLSGKSAVNRYFASATFGRPAEGGNGQNNNVSVGSIGATKMAGPPEAMQFETDYFNKLEAVNRYELTSSNRLRLYYTGTQPGVLVYEKVK